MKTDKIDNLLHNMLLDKEQLIDLWLNSRKEFDRVKETEAIDTIKCYNELRGHLLEAVALCDKIAEKFNKIKDRW